jgi:5-methylthioadenosine/S-adenosylhomocysteine deaminase
LLLQYVSRRAAILFVLFSALFCGAQQPSQFTLRGTIITPDEVLTDGFVSVRQNQIAETAAISGRGPASAIETDSIILPGLIDLHNHITWNFLPRWKPNELFGNRYDWQQRSAYKIALDIPHGKVFAESGLPCDADRYGEVKAIAGGATSVVGSLTPFKPDDNRCIMGLARNLDNYSGLGPPGALNQEKVRYEVFPFEMKLADAAQVRADLDSGKLKAFLIHVGEGSPTNAAAAREFRMLDKRGDGFLRPGVSIIHGVALGKPDFAQMSKNKVGLIWSPRSNIELYGATTDVRAAKEQGVKIALAPDWSPSGSDGFLQELEYAATWNAAQFPPVFTSKELVQMATSIPAELAGLEKNIGRVAPGYSADLLLIRKQPGEPYETVLHTSPADVRLVIINGVAIYGDADLMNRLSAGRKLETINICGKSKAIFMDPQSGVPETQKSFTQIAGELQAALSRWGEAVTPLTECAVAGSH